MISTFLREQISRFVPPHDLLLDEPMSGHTTFRVGGSADLFINISSHDQLTRLIACLRDEGVEFFILGNGSNVLVGDKGYRGAILHIGEKMAELACDGDLITAGAGASLTDVAGYAADRGLGGLEFASGIPGTIGGGVVMNAGAFDSDMEAVTESVLAMDGEGELMEIGRQQLGFGYRSSIFKTRPYTVISVTLRLERGDSAAIKGKMSELTKRRRDRQPLQHASAGSTFKRPQNGYAGQLIMDAGLSGFTVGGASVSDKHCGFVINRGDARAADVLAVIRSVQDRVSARFGITLEPEIIYLGDF